MQLRSIISCASFLLAFGMPALAQSNQASLIDFNHGDKRSEGTVVWRSEQVKTPDGRDDLAIRADVDIPGRNMKLSMSLRRNLDPTIPASHLIELSFTTPPDFIDGAGLGSAVAMMAEPKEMSVGDEGLTLWGTLYKMQAEGKYVDALSEKPRDICANLAALMDNAWLAVYLNGAKRKANVFLPAVSDESLWFSKGETGQQVFTEVFSAWEKTPEPGARGAICHPS